MSGVAVFILSFVFYVLALGLYDYYLIKTGKASISQGMVNAAKSAPIIAFLFGLVVGVLGGHFFWQFLYC